MSRSLADVMDEGEVRTKGEGKRIGEEEQREAEENEV